MVVITKGPRPFFVAGRFAMRRERIRRSWSPWERRERNREATVRIQQLWKLIQSHDSFGT